MLCDLHIQDFVIAEELLLEFDQGLTVLTGETGAGKSILIGALGLVLGDRADTQSVRTGADKAQISAMFALEDNDRAKRWLDDNDLDSNNECVIRRVIHANGRSKAFINGKPAPLQQVKEIGGLLVDIHGQHEHQGMVKASVQRQLLDHSGTYAKQLDDVAKRFQQWKTQQQTLEDLRQQLADRSARLDLLNFQTDELETLVLLEGEYEALSEEQYKISHVATLAESSLEAIDLLGNDESGSQRTVSHARKALSNILNIDSELVEFDQLLESAEIQIEEAVSGLQRYADKLEIDPSRRDYVEQRLDAISGLAKKHRVEPQSLISHLCNLQRELAQLNNAEESILELEQSVAKNASAYLTSAKKLSRARVKAAKVMASRISELVKQLGMPESIFDIEVISLEGSGADTSKPTVQVSPTNENGLNATHHWREDGIDSVQFMIQANPGEPARPVAKVASGGELSRISLAVQVVSASDDASTCMVFDEIDSGVGGAVADMIGRRLQELGRSRQVMVVTHSPQVACHGHQHFKVSKTSIDNRTRSQVALLANKQSIEELARMLGGAEVTATTRRHAKELVSQAQKQRQSA